MHQLWPEQGQGPTEQLLQYAAAIACLPYALQRNCSKWQPLEHGLVRRGRLLQLKGMHGWTPALPSQLPLLLCAGASIAIDDCYELWESGFISIPYNFNLKDLQPQLQRLLGTASSASSNSASASSSSGAELEGSDTSYQPGKEAGNGLVMEAPAKGARLHRNGNNVVASCSQQRHSCFGWQAADQRLHTTLSKPTCSATFRLALHPVRPQHPHLQAVNSRCKYFNVNFKL